MSEEEIVEFVNKKTVKELDKILRLKGRSLKGNKKDKQSRVLNVILSERGNEEKTAEGEGEVTAEANMLILLLNAQASPITNIKESERSNSPEDSILNITMTFIY